MSVILLVETEWKIWYSDLLKPYVHYIPIKNDLSDIIDKIKWCRDNDEKCKEIAKNTKSFYNKYLEKESIFDYLQKTFVDLKKHTGTYLYNTIKPLDLQIQKEYKYIKSLADNINELNDNYQLPNMGRCYGLLKGIEMVKSVKNIHQHMSFEKQIFTNKLGSVNLFSLLGFNFSIKNTTDYNKTKEHIHETFIGLNCINKIIKEIPNFSYVFGMYKNKKVYNVITEYIKGQTLKDYITSDDFVFSEYIFIILQICLALHVSQKLYCFVHNDLTPWNIIIQKLKTPITVDYNINYKKVIRIKTNIIPIIIDYGKSHVVHDNKHYGYINMFNFSTVNDIYTLLVTSIYQILVEKHLSKDDFGYLLKLSNFLCIKKDNFTNSKDLKMYLYSVKKYSNLISENKYGLEQKTPLNLFHYIRKNLKYTHDIDMVNNYSSNMNKGNPLQVYEYIVSKNDKERLDTYINYFNNIKNINIDFVHNDLVLTYYLAQNILEDINYNHVLFLNYLKLHNLPTKSYLYIDNNITNIKAYFEFKLSKSKINTYKIYNNINYIKYNEDIFLVPEKVKNYPFCNNKNYICEYKDILEHIFLNKGHFRLKNKVELEKILYNYLNVNEIDNKLYDAYNNTLIKNIKIYKSNMEYIERIEDKDKDIIKNYNNYSDILKTIV